MKSCIVVYRSTAARIDQKLEVLIRVSKKIYYY